MQDTSVQIPTGIKLVFSRCDICERPYEEEEMKLKNATEEYSKEDMGQNEPLLLLCDSCRQTLEGLPTLTELN